MVVLGGQCWDIIYVWWLRRLSAKEHNLFHRSRCSRNATSSIPDDLVVPILAFGGWIRTDMHSKSLLFYHSVAGCRTRMVMNMNIILE